MQARQMVSIMRRMLPGLALIAMAMVFTGCAEDVEDIRTAGIDQFRNRQHIESMATLRYALSKNPNDAESNYYMGLNYRALAEREFNEGDLPAAKRTLDTAIFYFAQAVKTWPNYMAATQAKNEALESRGKFDAALAVVERSATVNRGMARNYVVLGDEYRERADFDNALRAYTTALATDPDNARAHAGLGKLYWATGNRELAIQSFNRAHALDPSEASGEEMIAQLDPASEAIMAGPLPPEGPAARPTLSPTEGR